MKVLLLYLSKKISIIKIEKKINIIINNYFRIRLFWNLFLLLKEDFFQFFIFLRNILNFIFIVFYISKNYTIFFKR